jgi:hypothetical protein
MLIASHNVSPQKIWSSGTRRGRRFQQRFARTYHQIN